MAKKGTVRSNARLESEVLQTGRDGAPALAPAASTLSSARAALAAGNVRAARSLARKAASEGPEAVRAEATALLETTRADPRSLVTVLVVIAIILFAAWGGLLRGH